jgi:hypothetical protein
MKARSLLTVFVLAVSLVYTSKLAEATSGHWMQSNAGGFGDANNFAVLALAPFDGKLYAGTGNESGNGAQLWRSSDTGAWSVVVTDGFGNANNTYIAHMIGFRGQLYASTRNEVEGGQVWRSDNGSTWSPITLPGFDSTNGEIVRFTIFDGEVYASTCSFTDTHGAEIWGSSTGDSGDWTQVVSNGFDGDVNNDKLLSFVEFNDHLYAGTDNVVTGAEVWYTDDSVNWSQVNADGFGDPYNWSVTLEVFGDYLYAGTYNYYGSDNPGAELWRCQVCDGADWQQVPVAKGFGDTENRAIRSLVVFNSTLFAVTYNRTSGTEVWRSSNGTNWSQVNIDGFGDSNNWYPYWDNSATVFNNSLYVGTWNSTDGGEVWHYLHRTTYLPLAMRTH